METSTPTTVTVLPTSPGRRWRPTRRSSEPTAVHDEHRDLGAPAELEPSAPDIDTSESMAAATALPAPAKSEPAPLAAFGRWMADFDSGPAASSAAAAAPPETAPTHQLPAYSSSVSSTAEHVTTPGEQPTYEPSPARLDDGPKIAELTRDLKELTDELETVRQRNGAERMRLLEELASARDARRAAETELAAVQAILEAAEQRLPAPRRGTLHAVS